ncbi:hypothetical protein FOL47_002330, partial [Perkinsus chesapeaki]
SQLLPYEVSDDRDHYDHAIKPTQDRLALIVKDKLPGGVEIQDFQVNLHWLLYTVDSTEGDELITHIYVAKFLHHNDSGDLTVQGLDKQADGSWRLPPRRVRSSTQVTIPVDAVLGGRGFLPTRGGWRIPRPVRSWFNGCGVDL